MSDNIIHSFQQRRQVSQAFLDLGQTETETELLEHVRHLVHSFPTELLTATLLKHLDTPNPQLRGGLGHLAALLPAEEIVPLLRGAAANRTYSAQMRITAAMLLERFLGETLPAALLGDLTQTNEVAFQSLREAVEEVARNRHILLEYLNQMHETNEHVALMILDLAERLAPEERVDLLRLMAQDEWPAAARSALGKLERLAGEHDAALTALVTLPPMLAPESAAQVERRLRKLQFSGRRHHPPAATGWRALLSPADMGGNFSVWFARTPQQGDDGLLMGMVLNLRMGVLQAFGAEHLPRHQMPDSQTPGHLVTVRTDSGQPAVLLEIPFDVGRRLLLQAHKPHWEALLPKPLPDEYKLFADCLWQFAPPVVEPFIAELLTPRAIASTSPGEPEELSAPASAEAWRAVDLDEAALHLLAHPAFAGWAFQPRLFAQSFNMQRAAFSLLPADELVPAMVRHLAELPEHMQLLAALAAALRAQAVWLHVAGSQTSAVRAQALAEALPVIPVRDNPLVRRLIAAGIDHAKLGLS
jgi:hypothetical protein